MFNGWPCSLWPSNPHCQNSPYNGYNPPQLPAFSRSRVHRDNWLYWVFREYFSGGTRLSCPSTPQLSSNPWSLLKYHHVSVSLSWVLGRWACSFYVASLSHKFFFWAKSSNMSWEEKKLSIHSLWPNLSILCQNCHWRGLVSGTVPPFVCLYRGKY